jgi:predicted site-specific integrase-resolvase
VEVLNMSKKDGPGRRWVRNKRLAEYLDVTEMTIWRWKRDGRLKFPLSSVINGIEYNDLDQIDEWLKARATSRVVEAA